MQLPKWIARLLRRESEPDLRRNLIIYDTSVVKDLSCNKWMVGQMLFRLTIERGLTASEVSVDRYVYDQVVKAGKFVKRDTGDVIIMGDMELNEQDLADAFVRTDVLWLMNNRDRLMREALASGGEAEYVFLNFKGLRQDYVLNMDYALNRRLIFLHYLSQAETGNGAHAVIEYAGEKKAFRLPVGDPTTSDVIPILDHIINICQER